MSTLAFWADLAFSAVQGGLYALVAQAVVSRDMSVEQRLPNISYASWWWALVVLSAAGIIIGLVSLWTDISLVAMVTYTQFVIFTIIVALTSILYYFMYLFTGKQQAWVPVALFYVASFFFLIYYIQMQQPIGVETASGTPSLEYANDLSGVLLGKVVGLLVLVPVMIGALAYLSLIRKAPGGLRKFRIAVVSLGIFVWFFISLGGSLTPAGDASSWFWISNSIGVVVAGLNLIAFRPPKWLLERIDSPANHASPVQNAPR